MLGRVIMFSILFVFMFAFTGMAIIDMRRGGEYIQRGMLGTILVLLGIPMIVFDLKFPVGLWVGILLGVVYITFYTRMYFKIKEERKDDKKKALFDCVSGISLIVAVTAVCSIDDEFVRPLLIVMCIIIYLAICYFVKK